MSNTERHPIPRAIGHGTRDDSRPDDPAERDDTELLTAREVPLGGPRAMLVRRALPNRDRRMVGAWCFADAYGPDDVSTGAGMQVLPHPHTGLQTVSWLVSGEVHHRDSLGSDQSIRPGQLNLMTAGHGIAHSEVSPPDRPPTLHGAQLWVALPDASRHDPPTFESHGRLPHVRLPGATITVLMGAVGDAASPASTYSPLVGAELDFEPSGRTRVPLRADFEHAVLALTDGLVVAGQPVPSGAMVYTAPGRTSLDVVAGDSGAVAMLLGGRPFEEELVMWWNFVGRTHDDVADARKAWQVERELPPQDRTRFGYVEGHDDHTLPAPELPGVELKARPRHRHL